MSALSTLEWGGRTETLTECEIYPTPPRGRASASAGAARGACVRAATRELSVWLTVVTRAVESVAPRARAARGKVKKGNFRAVRELHTHAKLKRSNRASSPSAVFSCKPYAVPAFPRQPPHVPHHDQQVPRSQLTRGRYRVPRSPPLQRS